MKKLDDFLVRIFLILPELENSYVSLQGDWKPDNPPETVIMGELARGIDPEKISKLQEIQLFDLFEEGLSSSNKKLGDTIATGLLECLFDTYVIKEKIDDDFWKRLGSNCTSFLKGITNFYQIEINNKK